MAWHRKACNHSHARYSCGPTGGVAAAARPYESQHAHSGSSAFGQVGSRSQAARCGSHDAAVLSCQIPFLLLRGNIFAAAYTLMAHSKAASQCIRFRPLPLPSVVPLTIPSKVGAEVAFAATDATRSPFLAPAGQVLI